MGENRKVRVIFKIYNSRIIFLRLHKKNEDMLSYIFLTMQNRKRGLVIYLELFFIISLRLYYYLSKIN